MQSLSVYFSTLEIELVGESYPKPQKAILKTGQTHNVTGRGRKDH